MEYGMSARYGSTPQTSFMTSSRMRNRAKVRINEMTSPRSATRRMNARSSSGPAVMPTRPQAQDEPRACVGAEAVQAAVRDIQDAHDAVDERQPCGNQEQVRREEDSVEDDDDDFVHGPRL